MFEIRTDRTLDEYWGLHIKADREATDAARSAVPFEDDAAEQAAKAAELREQAQRLLLEADGHDARARKSADEGIRWRYVEQEGRAVANDHQETVQRLIEGTNRQHPAERFQQAAATFENAPLEAPLPPPVVPAGHDVGDTQGFAQPEPVS